jgi:hypothetical protein
MFTHVSKRSVLPALNHVLDFAYSHFQLIFLSTRIVGNLLLASMYLDHLHSRVLWAATLLTILAHVPVAGASPDA